MPVHHEFTTVSMGNDLRIAFDRVLLDRPSMSSIFYPSPEAVGDKLRPGECALRRSVMMPAALTLVYRKHGWSRRLYKADPVYYLGDGPTPTFLEIATVVQAIDKAVQDAEGIPAEERTDFANRITTIVSMDGDQVDHPFYEDFEQMTSVVPSERQAWVAQICTHAKVQLSEEKLQGYVETFFKVNARALVVADHLVPLLAKVLQRLASRGVLCDLTLRVPTEGEQSVQNTSSYSVSVLST